MVEITKKLQKYGNAYAILVPKALIDCKVFEIGDELKITLEKAKSLKGDTSQEHNGESYTRTPKWWDQALALNIVKI